MGIKRISKLIQKRKTTSSIFITILSAFLVLTSSCGSSTSNAPSHSNNNQQYPASATYAGSSTEVSHVNSDSSGSAVIESGPLNVKYQISIKDENGRPVSGMAIDYFEKDGASLIYAFDPSGKKTSAFIFAPPQEISSIHASNIQGFEISKEEQAYPDRGNIAPLIVVGIIITVISISLATYNIIDESRKIKTFYITDVEAYTHSWIVYCKTWEEIAQLMKSRSEIVTSSADIIISLLTMGGATKTVFAVAVKAGGAFLKKGISTIRDKLLGAVIDQWGQSMQYWTQHEPVPVLVLTTDQDARLHSFRNLFAVYQIKDTRYNSFCETPVENTISGTVISAVDADPISSVQITLTGPTSATATTGTDGRYSINRTLSSGSYTIKATKSGYTPDQENFTYTSGQTKTINFVLSPSLSSDQYRVVLTWGLNPRDLDSHLWTPGDTYHIYFNNKGSTTSPPYVHLDVDCTTGTGPETITISRSSTGIYTYAVYNYSGSPAITSSEAHVQLFSQEGLVREWNVPTSGTGLWWHVFDLNAVTGGVTSVNQIKTGNP